MRAPRLPVLLLLGWALAAPPAALAGARPAGADATRGAVQPLAISTRVAGVAIHAHDGAAPSPRRGPRVEWGPVDPRVLERNLPVVEQTLALYPEPFRERTLREVWLVGRLRVGGTPFLGMAHPRERRLDLALRPRTRPAALVGTIHHEVAHVIFGRAVDASAWRAHSEGSYVGRKPSQAWGKGRPWLEQGFVSAYASKNPHEDFAETAELAFTRPDRVRALALRFPRIEAKLDHLTRVYRAEVPGMALPWEDGAAARR